MSKEAAQMFSKKAPPAPELTAAVSRQDWAAVCALGKLQAFQFTTDEAREVWSAQGALTDAEMEKVAGGVSKTGEETPHRPGKRM